jgi:hypothetical protein
VSLVLSPDTPSPELATSFAGEWDESDVARWS